MENDYIFVEGNRYVSAKRAAEITGYTSDYIGQIAREGKIRSKKIGRIRFVEEGEVKNYTLESDRKKAATENLATIISPNLAVKDEPIINSEPERPKPNYFDIIAHIEAIENLSNETEDPYTVDATPTDDVQTLEEIVDVTPETAEDPVSVTTEEGSTNTQDEDIKESLDIQSIASKVGALAVALLIVFGPYTAKESGLVSSVAESVSVTYESAKFDSENMAMALYQKANTEGWLSVVFDSLEGTEMRVRDTVANSFYGFIKLGNFVRNVPEFVGDDIRDGSVYDKMLGSISAAFDAVVELFSR